MSPMIHKLTQSILKDQAMLEVLETVRSLELSDCWIGAGFVRNKAWDLLHGVNRPLVFTDVDVVFFDVSNRDNDQYDKEIEDRLKVINQARTHLWHNRDPYIDTTDAISDWVETATCVAVQLSFENKLIFTAPHGFSDLENLILRPVPSLKNIEVFTNRVNSKKWLKKWPKLQVLSIKSIV